MSDFVKVKSPDGREHLVNQGAIASVSWCEGKWNLGPATGGAFEVHYIGGGLEYFAENPIDPSDTRRPQPLMAEVA